MSARYERDDPAIDVVDLIRQLRGRGLGLERVAAILNSETGKRSYPPPPGASAWTGFLVRELSSTKGKA